jgi:quinol monooxygenase YgiN
VRRLDEGDVMAVTAFLDLHLKADAVDRASEALGAILKDTRAFDGSLGIEVVQDLADPAHVTIVERWESIQHDDAYRAWRATPEGASDLGELVAAAPVLWRCETLSTY